MAWVAFDRGVKAVERFGRSGAASSAGGRSATEIHAEVCEKAFDAELNSFTQSYGSKRLDASLLMIPLVGFLPADDPRMVGTVAAIERDLCATASCTLLHDDEHDAVDGLPPGEGAFLPCTLLARRQPRAAGPARRGARSSSSGCSTSATTSACSPRSTTRTRRALGNFPQAFTHVALVNTAFNLSAHDGRSIDQRAPDENPTEAY